MQQQLATLYKKTKESLLSTNKNNPDRGIQIIKQVQASLASLKQEYPNLHHQISTLQIISLNNLACAYNKKAKFRASLCCLGVAEGIEGELFGDRAGLREPEVLHQVATTHSNKCAVLSQMGDHEKAYQEISSAIQLLLRTETTKNSDALVVFYFNCAVELEYLNKLNDSLKTARKGYNLAASVNQQMERRFVELIEKLEQKMKKREKKVAKLMIESMKMRHTRSIREDSGSFKKRGNSLNLISTYGVQDAEMQKADINKEVKQFSSYLTKMPKLGSKNVRATEYPNVRLPVFNDNSRQLGLALGLEQRKKVISLYSPNKREKRIPRNHRINLKKRQQSLQKIIVEEI